MRNGNWKDDEVDESYQRSNLQNVFDPKTIKEQYIKKQNDR
jgi:hypothetical protein